METSSKMVQVDLLKYQDFVQTTTKGVTWKIQKFKALCIDTGFSLDSPQFYFENATWCLRLYPKCGKTSKRKKKCTEKEEGYIGLSLVRLWSLVPCHVLTYNFSWEDGHCTESHSEVHFDENHREDGSMEFIDRVTAFKRTYEIYKTDTLTLTCQVSSDVTFGVSNEPQTEIFIQKGKASKALCENYKNLLDSRQDYDVVLKVKDRNFHAHRSILWARSPVMASMLSHDMTEKKSGVIHIPDCDPTAFEQFLSYVYCAKLDTLSVDNMLSLYYIADKYDVGDLKEECRQLIQMSLSSTNITDVIEVALNHSDEGLLNRATEYFVKEVNEILPTAEWQSFFQRNSTRANELILKSVKKP